MDMLNANRRSIDQGREHPGQDVLITGLVLVDHLRHLQKTLSRSPNFLSSGQGHHGLKVISCGDGDE
jgi:hypothetical protein